ncbi:MAG: MFS transporter [Gammaproteobacteria bacterium]|nr:MAG: MFS transporter [Gammaproteobacteria bacterium]
MNTLSTPLAQPTQKILNATIIIAALGYFVDVYDLILFLIIGKKSLAELYPAWAGQPILLEKFQHLLDLQMTGMLVGGIAWGIIGDKKGRLAVLFGSIICYSLANLANAFVTDMTTYEILRFVAGFGLAGELGAGVCLVAEMMDKNKRGLGTMLVASVGLLGAVAAALVAQFKSWQVCYIIGGVLGLGLLVLRISTFESAMFKKANHANVRQGNFLMMFTSRDRFFRLLKTIVLGLPVWFVIGLLVARAPEIAKTLKVQGDIAQNLCILLAYSGLVIGDLASGTTSQLLRSRKKAFAVFYVLCTLTMFGYLNLHDVSSTIFYSAIFLLGFSVGFWALFVTNASEQFGTNLRATSAISVPNFARGSLVPIAWIYTQVNSTSGNMINSFLWVGGGLMLLSFITLYFVEETFAKDLDFYEH